MMMHGQTQIKSRGSVCEVVYTRRQCTVLAVIISVGSDPHGQGHVTEVMYDTDYNERQTVSVRSDFCRYGSHVCHLKHIIQVTSPLLAQGSTMPKEFSVTP